MNAKKLSDELRDAVNASGLSRYAIAKAIGVAASTLSRFMNGKGGLSMDYIDRLGGLLDLHVISGKRKDGCRIRSG
jgi:plasmid maintenance system antidote protein VapI